MSDEALNRRDLLKGAVAATALGALGARALGQDAAPIDSRTPMTTAIPRRALGKTGFEATILGFGGYPISEVGEKDALATIHVALEAGVNYYDTASTYGDHKSEGYLGQVLPSVPRESFFLTTKTLKRNGGHAAREIGDSLKALKVRPDLLQIHAVNDQDNLEAVMRKGGSLEAAIRAKEKGDVRFVGITGHTRPEVISRALDLHDWDTVLIPLGAPDHYVRSFVPVMEKARAKGVAVIGMKVLSGGHAVGKGVDLESLMHYTWNLPVSTAVIGARNADEMTFAVKAVRSFKPLPEERVAAILDSAKGLGNTETLWWKRV